MSDFDIEEELKKLPDKPGCYLMHDEKDEIIYVGKAVVLKNRVRQYFQSSRNLSPKIQRMVSHIRRFEYIVTDTELEALVLECNLIKLHRPHYNTMLMDDKTYPFIKITVNEAFPRIIKTRELKKDKCRYFGPFTSSKAVDDIIELLIKTYGIRDCRRILPRDIGKERACLNYHIGRCSGPCQGYISKEDYNLLVDRCIDFLEGRYGDIKKNLKARMQAASEAMEFEQAAQYRDMLASVDFIAQQQKITSDDMKDKDVIAAALDETDCVVQVFYIRDGKMIGREHFHMSLGDSEERSEVISQFIKQFYMGSPYIPPTIMIQDELTDAQLISGWLSDKSGHSVKLIAPKRGDKERLVELACENANIVLTKDKDRIKKEEARTSGAVRNIAEMIGLTGIHRMEAFDISNISGAQSVGSMVVFYDGVPRRNDYRKFKIKTVIGPNDYASMREVLTRRLTHEGNGFDVMPDLIMMDGGRGQVNIALEVVEGLGLNIPVCGMVKDDNHRTRALWYNDSEVPIDTHSEEFKLITRIQDEAHRFAITFHRDLRSKNQIHSVLDEIDGIGPSRRKALMKYFGDIEAIRKAGLDEIMKVPEINANVAQKVYDFFNADKGDDAGSEDE